MLTALQASAVSITDVYDLDLNRIPTNGYEGGQSGEPDTFISNEIYGESTLVEYPSHDGYAIVNTDLNYFDKVVTLGNSSGLLDFTFSVLNDSGYDWSDYHFVFFDTAFTTQNTGFGTALYDWSNDVVFLNSNYDQGELQFWAPAHHQNGDTRTYTLRIDLDEIGVNFGIRQIATTVPAPGSFALATCGLLLLGRLSRRGARL